MSTGAENLPQPVKRHLVREAMINGIVNVAINGGLAWWLMTGTPELAMWGEKGYAPDILATTFLLPLLMTLIVTPLARGQARKGAAPRLELGASSRWSSLLRRMPANLPRRALVFGIAGLLLVAPLTILGFYLANLMSISSTTYVVFKSLWAGFMAAVVAVPIIMLAMAETTPASEESA